MVNGWRDEDELPLPLLATTDKSTDISLSLFISIGVEFQFSPYLKLILVHDKTLPLLSFKVLPLRLILIPPVVLPPLPVGIFQTKLVPS